MTSKRHLSIALAIVLLICSQATAAIQSTCAVFQRLSNTECCGTSLMDSAGNVVIEAHSPLKYKGSFKSMEVRLCGNDILSVQLWEVVNAQTYEFKLVWQVDVHKCSTKKGWYAVNFPNNTPVVTDNTRLGYYSQSIRGVTEDKFAIPYRFKGTSYKIYRSNVTFGDPTQLNVGDVHHFGELRFPRSFDPSIVFYEKGIGPPGPPGAAGPPGICQRSCPGTDGFPNNSQCDTGEIDDLDRKLDSVQNDTDDMQREVQDLITIINRLLKSEQMTGTCPDGFLAASYGIGSCYIIIRVPAPYGVALMHCRDDYGANLLAIETDIEQTYIKNAIITSKVGDPEDEIFWTAGMNSKTTTSAWIWYDGTNYPGGKKRISTHHWAPGQPRSANSHQRCLKLVVEPGTNKGEWQAAVCDEWHYYICEIPKKCL